MEKEALKDVYSNKKTGNVEQASIIDKLKIRPVVYEVCRWEIDPITKKPRKVCWIEEPVNALVLK